MENYKYISKVEAKKLMDTDENLVILDVRKKYEFEEGHIDNSICVPLESLEKDIQNVVEDKNKKILIYCRSGKRSCEATMALSKMGYKDVSDFGGIIDWPFDIVM